MLQYMVEKGCSDIIAFVRQNLHVITTLKDFQYIDEGGRDQGLNGNFVIIGVRERSKTLAALVKGTDYNGIAQVDTSIPLNSDAFGGRSGTNEDYEMQQALEASKVQFNLENKKRNPIDHRYLRLSNLGCRMRNELL